jgi:hypothetical protein
METTTTTAPDEHAINELQLFADNDENLYFSRTMPVMRNQAKKFKKGVYDSALARKLWYSWASDAAKRYKAEFGGAAWFTQFPTDVRKKVAAEREADAFAEFTTGIFPE